MDIQTEILEKQSKLKKAGFSNKLVEDFSNEIVNNISNLIRTKDTLSYNKITLGFFYNDDFILDSSFKGLSPLALDVINKKANNSRYNQKTFDADKKRAIEEMLDAIAKVENLYGNQVLNKQYREELLGILIRKRFPTFLRYDKKIDYTVSELKLKSGEMKTCKVKYKNNKYSNARFEFDKQNDEIRRENTLKSDTFVFSGFDANVSSDSKILFYCFIYDKKQVNAVKKILKEKQKDFIKKMKIAKDEKKQISRDTIQITLKDLLTIKDIKFYDDNNKEIKISLY